MSRQYQFFHWHLAFPEVFAKGGFDCKLGNPPWERLKLQEKEFFAQRDPVIANAPNAATRKRLIANLPETNPDLWKAFTSAKRMAEGESHFLRTSGRYPLSAVGDLNTYQIFAGLFRELLSEKGRAGVIVPTGIATDDTNKQFFADLTEKKALVSLYDFENSEGIFPAVHREQKFCLLTMGAPEAAAAGTDFVFFLTNVAQLHELDRHFRLTSEEIAVLNPNTRTCPIFRSKRDAEITKAIYHRIPALIDESKGEAGNPWRYSFLRMFDMTNDAHLFKTKEPLELEEWHCEGNIFQKDESIYLPLYEGKLTQIYNHRFATFAGVGSDDISNGNPRELSIEEQRNKYSFAIPRYWVSADQYSMMLDNKIPSYWLTFHGIANPNNERTFIAAICPSVAMGNSIPVVVSTSGKISARSTCFLIANWNSLPLDYVSRLKMGSRNMNYFVVKQLPAVLPDMINSAFQIYICNAVLELTYNAYDMKPFTEDVWAELHPDPTTRPPLPEPFMWNEERRFKIRCELDALYFHLYGINRDDTDYILETFPIIRRRDEETYDGDYRTKRVILEIYDEMADAIRTGTPYQTRLDPPPADPRCCHQPRTDVD